MWIEERERERNRDSRWVLEICEYPKITVVWKIWSYQLPIISGRLLANSIYIHCAFLTSKYKKYNEEDRKEVESNRESWLAISS